MIQSRRMFRATLVQVDFPYTTKAGVVRLGFTNHDQPLVRTLYSAELTFSPEFIVEETSYNTKLNTAIDDTELRLKIDDDVVNWFDIRTRAWHNAEVRVGYCNWKNAAHGTYIQALYLVSNTYVQDGVLVLELRGKERLLEMSIAKRLTANCQHTFGDSRCSYDLTPNAWAANTAYAVSVARDHRDKRIVKPTVQNGFWYEATTGGTSGGTEPTWPTTIGGTVADGTVTWTARYAGRMTGSVTGVIDEKTFSASGISASPADWFAKGRVLWLTGDNATLRMKCYSDDGAGNIILEEGCYNTIQVGDTFLIDAGCRKRITTDCSTKFDNTKNAWAFPHLVQEDATVKAPKG
jgi:hypothetical protein